jgi:3-dehydroquinate dehydratase-2
MNILVINGPNLNLLGTREVEIYGHTTYQDLVDIIAGHAAKSDCVVEIHQSNHEGEIIDIIQNNYRNFDGIVINPGAYAHYSYAIYDCLKAINIPAIEVHISDVNSREPFRKNLVTKDACKAMISGLGVLGYTKAIDMLIRGEHKS